MKKKKSGAQEISIKNILKLFLFMAVSMQLIVPLYMIITNETALNKGAEYKFLVRPYDPYDPFRGRYVNLRYVDDTAATGIKFERGARIYVTIQKGSDGFAKPEKVMKEKPGAPGYVEATVGYYYGDEKNKIKVKYLSTKLFMNEKIAPKVDKAMWRYKGKMYVTARVKNGKMLLKKLYFDGTEASEFVKDKE